MVTVCVGVVIAVLIVGGSVVLCCLLVARVDHGSCSGYVRVYGVCFGRCIVIIMVCAAIAVAVMGVAVFLVYVVVWLCALAVLSHCNNGSQWLALRLGKLTLVGCSSSSPSLRPP